MIITEEMIFDTKTKRFRLTNDYVYNEMGLDLANALIDEFDTNLSTIAERTLRYTSNQLYNFLSSNAVRFWYGNSYDTACYLIATNKGYYDAFRDALEQQLYSFIQNGDDLSGEICQSAYKIMQSMGMFHKIIPNANIPKEW